MDDITEDFDTRSFLRRAHVCLLATASAARVPLVEAVRAAIRGGVDMVQLREKDVSDAELLPLCVELRDICRHHCVIFVVNDSPKLAYIGDSDGVHLGQDDEDPEDARLLIGDERIIGVSTHDRTELDAALAAGADYVGVGCAFPTATKDVAVRGPAVLAPLARAAEDAGVPAFAIGGITVENAAEVAAAGFRRVAVCGGILDTDDPAEAARAIRLALGN